MPWLLPRALSDPTQLTHLTHTPSPAAPARSGLQRRCYRLPACLPSLGALSGFTELRHFLITTCYRRQTPAQVIREAKSNGRRRRRRQRESESETQAAAVD
jgi:hypothetical protein